MLHTHIYASGLLKTLVSGKKCELSLSVCGGTGWTIYRDIRTLTGANCYRDGQGRLTRVICTSEALSNTPAEIPYTENVRFLSGRCEPCRVLSSDA